MPVFCKPRSIPFAYIEKVEKELERLEKENVIEKVENAQWGTPLVPVIKPNGTVRLCADYKTTINKYLEDYNYPLLKVEELFVALQGGKFFSKLDFINAYNQLEICEDTQKLLAWSTHKGIYKVKRLPFGTKPACSIFQQVIEKVLQGLKGVKNFLDDIIVTGVDDEDHLNNLREVFKRLLDAGFKLNVNKCCFFQKQVNYLGHVIDGEGIRKDKDKVKAIVEARIPQNVTEVKAFVGMINYYAKFIPNLSTLLGPMYKLLKKNITFKWTNQCNEAFNKSKEAMTSDSVLVHFNPEIQVKLLCDASEYGVGAVLVHVFSDGTEKPISYASRVLTVAERKYAVIQKEALAIFWSVKKFSQYLLGRKFILCSDHKPLLALFGEHNGIPRMASNRLQRWTLFLSEFDYELKYVQGRNNCAADGLSRLPLKIKSDENDNEYSYIDFVEGMIPLDVLKIKIETRKNTILSKVYSWIEEGWPEKVDLEYKGYFIRKSELNIEKGVIMWGYRVIIPNKLRIFLLKEIHSTHAGIAKMKAVTRSYFWWPGLDKEIESYVKSCEVCVSCQASPVVDRQAKWVEAVGPLDRVHLDFLYLNNKNYLVWIDAFTKWPEVIEMSKMNSGYLIDKLRETFGRFGLPNKIISDNGPQFRSSEFIEFCKQNGIVFYTSPPFHPATNGAAENAVKSFKRGINKALKDKINKGVTVSTLINRYLFMYRNSPHWTTNECPAKLMFGRKLKTRLDFLRHSKIKTNTESYKNKTIRNEVFKEGDVVYARDFSNPNKKNWEKAVIEEVLGNRNYIVRLEDKELVWRRHINHIIKLEEFSKYDDYIKNYEKEFLEEVKEKEKEIKTQELEIKKASEKVDEKEKQNITDVNVNDKFSLPEVKQNNVRPVRNKKSPKRLDL
ncbi:uncharacterized protein K02A2.6-like [Acyrthosiphon pisum]|uniref:RNA-directed DNA polymerase n=1 Tax=Acyrthosiphon pisum TaxID=7029 RepID=A0A8R2FDJ1_ACYPI|nr:uncharacterized protein K02A2.6-like [Acyrthosiphon pisum]|eukprot:XP_008190241.1 PREDICTED: uncharacterized protein K02A2.6-like [Acyrthosiphon pisum]